jgi:hypothetical protein|tara:strand:- start:5006 stop:5551 length:546 start_codon:yes stop_codon:yes gene_type:complete
MAKDLFIEEDLYNIGQNKGFLELGLNPKAKALAANVTNQYSLNNGGWLNATAGASYLPSNKNQIIPRIAASYNSPDGDYIKALIEENKKTAEAGLGNLYGNITQTDNDLIKQIGLQGQNLGASIRDSNEGRSFGLNALFNNVLGGDVSANAYKNNYGSGVGLEYEASTEDLYDYVKGLLSN